MRLWRSTSSSSPRAKMLINIGSAILMVRCPCRPFLSLNSHSIIGKRYDEFMQISTVKADLSNLRSKLVERRSPDDNSRYYRLDFEVEIVFDSINLRANIIRDVRIIQICYFCLLIITMYKRARSMAMRSLTSTIKGNGGNVVPYKVFTPIHWVVVHFHD